jgi:hypothetical protein
LKKSLMLFTGMLFALSSVIARADHGGSSGASSGNSGRGNQNVPAVPGNNDPAGDANAVENEDQDEEGFLVFGSMVGVDGSFVGSDAIRGVVGGGLPWMAGRVRGSLSASGRLKIDVRGLVLVNDPSVPVAQVGTNPMATFRGVVSCVSDASGGGGIVTVNVMTDPFPATPAGNSKIDGLVTLPAQCLAPIVFVTNGAGDAWLAVTGSVTVGP